MNLRSQKEKADVLLSLHRNGKLLVLPNVWNPIGARILEKKGFPAVATASAAISASLGYQDGEKINRSTAIDLIGRIARSVDVPVTADIETGYAECLSELEMTAQQVVDSGAVGVNIEDGLEWGGTLRSIDDQCQRIATLRQYADRRGVHLVINARTDSFVSSLFTNKEEAMEEAGGKGESFR
jgi:2-methylisocitrate lyase-like PEP mutase family enzyme